ncbi:hypothetical protein AB4Y32_17170 [Paraburkholderia phymatum]|uniref:Uncharacterized protein n=1 Tax=Paraburkholderia phymatum TaxID=148447 RepID=A0ACC6U1R9_9BURK
MRFVVALVAGVCDFVLVFMACRRRCGFVLIFYGLPPASAMRFCFDFLWLAAGIRDAVLFWFLWLAASIRDAPRGAGAAPVRGGTYFSLPPQRKVGKRKRANTASA